MASQQFTDARLDPGPDLRGLMEQTARTAMGSLIN